VFDFVDYVAILKELTDRRARHQEVRRVIDAVGLSDVADRRIRALSGGMRRRVGVAQAILGDPELVILDEPTAGLDPEQRLRFRDLVSRIGEGRTVLLSTHMTEDVSALCPRVVVVDGGRTVFDGTPSALTGTADGRVWLAADRDPSARLAWRTADGDVRNIGDAAPAGATTVPPTLEDAYLLLVGEACRDGGSSMTDLWSPGPAPARRGAAASGSGSWALVADLARVQAIPHHAPPGVPARARLVRRAGGPRRAPAHLYAEYSTVTGSVAYVVGPIAFFAANLVASSGRRSGADEWTPSLPMTRLHRTTALLLACLAPAAFAAVLDLAVLLLIRSYGGLDMHVYWQHLASVPITVLGGAVLGVAVARLLPWTGVPLVVVVGLVSFNLWITTKDPYLGFYVDFPVWTTPANMVPAMVPGDPSWHLVFLLALTGLAACGALLRDARRWWLPFTGGAVLGALVLVSGTLQLA
jgi:hypothetical protein